MKTATNRLLLVVFAFCAFAGWLAPRAVSAAEEPPAKAAVDKGGDAKVEEPMPTPQAHVPAADEICRRLVRTRMSWGRMRVARGETPVDLGFLNQRAPDVFGATPAGAKAADAAYDFRVASFITGLLSGAVYIADFGFLAARLGSNSPWDHKDTAVGLGMLGGGLLLQGASEVLNNASNDRLGRAVAAENDHVVNDTLSSVHHAGTGVVPLPRGMMLATSFSF